jgi:hypothetical protein
MKNPQRELILGSFLRVIKWSGQCTTSGTAATHETGMWRAAHLKLAEGHRKARGSTHWQHLLLEAR